MKLNRDAGLVGALFAAASAMAAGPPYEHKIVPGASPEPIAEGAGLRSQEDLAAFVDGVMAAHMKQNRLAGAQVVVVKDGEVFFMKGYGYSDLEKQVPVDPGQSLFRPGSVAKMFTWTAVMQLVEQGKLDLDADVNTYLTQFKIPSTFEQPITLRNALTHTPGLEDGAVGYLFVKTPEDVMPLADAVGSHIPTRVRPPTTDFADGSNASYSNWATALAGLIVANVSGMSFDEYVEKNIFGPLDMKSSSFRQPLPAELAPRMAMGYEFKAGALKLNKHGFEVVNFTPAGSLSSTAADMAKFMIAHLNLGEYKGQRILKEETAKLMQSRQFSPNPYVNGSGLGFFETWVNGRRIVGHWGDMLYFHTAMDLLPDEKIGIYVCYNTSNGIGPGIARRDLLRGFMDRYFPAKLPRVTPPADFKERAARYAGKYRFNRHNYTKIEKVFGLAGATTVAPTKEGTLMIAAGGEPSQWVEIAPNVFRQVDRDDTIAFFEGADGQVTGMTFPLAFIAFYKLAWHQSPALHYFILGFGLLCFVVAIVSALRHWKADRAADATARRARRVAAALGAVQIAFLVMVGGVLAAGLDELFFGFPGSLKVALALPLVAIPLTLGVLYLAWRVWASGAWTRYGRVQYSVIALVSVAYLWSLNYWNLIGYKFG